MDNVRVPGRPTEKKKKKPACRRQDMPETQRRTCEGDRPTYGGDRQTDGGEADQHDTQDTDQHNHAAAGAIGYRSTNTGGG